MEFGTKFFFPPFKAYLSPIWIEILLEWCFWVLLLFFWEFSSPGRVGSELGTIFFFFFFFIQGLSLLGLDRNIAGMMFFYFLNFFAIFFGISYPGSSRNEILDKIYFISFSAYLTPVWIEKKCLNEVFKFFEFFCYIFGIL